MYRYMCMLYVYIHIENTHRYKCICIKIYIKKHTYRCKLLVSSVCSPPARRIQGPSNIPGSDLTKSQSGLRP